MRLELELGKQAPKEQKKNKPFTNPMLCSAMLCSKRSPQGTKEEQTISVQFSLRLELEQTSPKGRKEEQTKRDFHWK